MISLETPPRSRNPQDEQHQVGPYDILCGRSKVAFNNVGNRRFRVTISLALERFRSAPTRKDKSVVIKSVAGLVAANGGRFMVVRKGKTVLLDERQAHEKVGHALRDMAMAANKSVSCSSLSRSAPSSMRIQQARIDLPHQPKQPVDPGTKLSLPNEPQRIFTDLEIEHLPQKEEGCLSSRDSLDDNMLSWLVGESDGMMKLFEM